MRILILAPFAEHSGYGHAAGELARALASTGAEIAARTVFFAGGQEPPDLKPLLSKTMASPDAILQVVPPYAQSWVPGSLNAGYFFTETDPLPNAWAARASLLDFQIAPCSAQRSWCENSPRWQVPTAVVPVPCDPAEYARSYPPTRLLPPDARGRFLFYTVGELTPRKNLRGLLLAYFTAFRGHEPVGLVVKGGGGHRGDALVASLVAEVQAAAKLPRVPPVYPVCERLSREALLSLHASCDVFVSASMGEGTCLPAQDAMGMGKTPIVTAAGGPLDFVDDQTGWLVPARPEPCSGEGPTHAALFTARSRWAAPDPLALGRALRDAYSDPDARARKATAGADRVRLFSRPAVGRRLLEVLRGATEVAGPARRGRGRAVRAENPA